VLLYIAGSITTATNISVIVGNYLACISWLTIVWCSSSWLGLHTPAIGSIHLLLLHRMSWNLLLMNFYHMYLIYYNCKHILQI
jgi:hypothetical protein